MVLSHFAHFIYSAERVPFSFSSHGGAIFLTKVLLNSQLIVFFFFKISHCEFWSGHFAPKNLFLILSHSFTCLLCDLFHPSSFISVFFFNIWLFSTVSFCVVSILSVELLRLQHALISSCCSWRCNINVVGITSTNLTFSSYIVDLFWRRSYWTIGEEVRIE